MPIVHIDLQEGFENDSVRLEINGRNVFTGDHVSTRNQIGLAKSLEIPVEPKADAVIELAVPTRSLNTEVTIETAKDLFISFSISGNSIEHRVQGTPFGYL